MALKRGTAGANTLRGTAAADTLLGLGGNDTLLGADGNDRIDGGTGRDRMAGGRGNDLYFVDRTDDLVIESAGQGTDTISSSVSLTLPKNVERLVLSGTRAINGTGNTLNNLVVGNEARNTLNGADGNDIVQGRGGDDRLLGGKGNDRLDGGTGTDRLEGGIGNDVYVVDRLTDRVIEGVNGGIDTVLTSVAMALPANVEALVLIGATNINLTGTSASNAMAGNAGNNVLNAGSGNDVVLGGAGNDSLIGGAGRDRLDGGAGNDSLAGGTENDILVGGTGNDVLDGGTGADSLVGGSGNDIYVIDNVGDRAVDADPGSVVVFPGPTALTGSTLAAQTQGTGGGALFAAQVSAASVGGVDEIRSATISLDVEAIAGAGGIEVARLLGNLDLNIIADDDSTATITLIGNAGINTIIGGAGNDIIDGGGGGDSLAGGDGDDTYIVDDVNDVVAEDANEGTDTVIFVDTDLDLNQLGNIENGTVQGNADVGLIGDGNDNVLIGTDGDNSILGNAGDDALLGEGGDDVLIGGAGTDVISGGSGVDQVTFSGLLADYTIITTGSGTTVTDNNAADGNDGADLVVAAESLVFGDRTVLAAQGVANLDGGNGFRITREGTGPVEFLGESVSLAGDVNGDGFADLVIGARANDVGSAPGFSAGAAFVVFGKASGFGDVDLNDVRAGIGGFMIIGDQDNDLAGSAVSGAGDINGDGLDDLIVGAYRANLGANQDVGKAYVVFGKASTTSVDLASVDNGSLGFVMNASAAFDFAGHSVSNAGDINGDGFADVLVGADLDDAGGTDSGAAFVVFGRGAGFSDIVLENADTLGRGFVLRGENASDQAGNAVANAGDFNGDGIADMIVGARLNDGGGSNAGAAYVVFGATSGLDSIDLDAIASGIGGFKITGEAAGDQAGSSVATAGDVNGDGFTDVIVGARLNDSGLGAAGAAYVVFGTDNAITAIDLDTIAAGTGGFKIIAANAGDQVGFSVASAGDINGDGVDDMIIGANAANFGGLGGGASYIVFGGADFSAGIDLADVEKGIGGFVVVSDGGSDQLGSAVSSAGDLNGDGFDDLAIGAVNDDLSGPQSGAGYILFGRDFDGVVTHPGTAADDTLTGGAGSDVLVGGLGNDVLDGGGGFDALNGGGGDDVLVFDAIGGQRFDGGLGFDTLLIGGAGASVNISAINANLGHYTLYQGIDAIDLVGTGDNAVTFDLRDTLAFAADSNLLRVLGDAGDTVNAGGSWTQHGNASIGGTTFAIYTQGGATLQVALAADRTDVKVGTFDMAGIADLGGFKIVGETAADVSGSPVASAGDINGDGFADMIIGAYLQDAGGSDAGAAYVVFGKASGFGPVNLDDVASGVGGFKIIGETSEDYAGFSVSSAGDIDGDGFADLFIGAYNHDAGGANAGAGYVVFGGNGAIQTINLDDVAAGVGGFKLIGETTGDLAGRNVNRAGDVNGDGFDDVILGAYRDDDGGADAGAAYVVLGGASFGAQIALADIAAGTGGNGGFKLLGEAVGDRTGFRVAGAGDFNGDGFDDVLASTVRDGTAGVQAGATYLVFGAAYNSGSISLSAAAGGSGGFKIIGENASDLSGYSTGAAGDINGDGLDDFAIGAVFNGAGGTLAGAGYVVFGSAAAPTSPLNLDNVAAGNGGFKIIGEAAGDQAGFSIGAAGDVNGDGFDDVIVGASDAGAGIGAAYVVFGAANLTGVNLDDVAKGIGGFKLAGEVRFDEFGRAAATAGDVDGDGFDDIIVGAYGNDAGGNAAGASYVFFGRDFTDSVTHQGTASNDVLTGTAGADIIVGGRGNDTITGGTGSDVMLGGAGDDVLVFDATDGRAVEGGAGFDMLRVASNGTAVNLSTINDAHFYNLYEGFEAFDLAAAGITLTLDVRDLLHLSDTTNTLRVDGSADDTITTSDAGWGSGVADADLAGYTTYTNGNAKLVVDTDIAQAGIQA